MADISPTDIAAGHVLYSIVGKNKYSKLIKNPQIQYIIDNAIYLNKLVCIIGYKGHIIITPEVWDLITIDYFFYFNKTPEQYIIYDIDINAIYESKVLYEQRLIEFCNSKSKFIIAKLSIQEYLIYLTNLHNSHIAYCNKISNIVYYLIQITKFANETMDYETKTNPGGFQVIEGLDCKIKIAQWLDFYTKITFFNIITILHYKWCSVILHNIDTFDSVKIFTKEDIHEFFAYKKPIRAEYIELVYEKFIDSIYELVNKPCNKENIYYCIINILYLIN